ECHMWEQCLDAGLLDVSEVERLDRGMTKDNSRRRAERNAELRLELGPRPIVDQQPWRHRIDLDVDGLDVFSWEAIATEELKQSIAWGMGRGQRRVLFY